MGRSTSHAEPNRRLRIDQIKLDLDVQVRDTVDQNTVDDYAEACKEGAKFPPVDIFHERGIYRVADGVHRVLGAKAAAVKEIRAVIHEGTSRDAFFFAAKCNCHHGRRRTNADKRLVVRKFLQDPEWGKKSTRWIAEACAVSHSFVANMKGELSTVDSSDRVEGRDGKLRPATMAHAKAPRWLDRLDIEGRQKRCLLWWDQLGKYVVLLDMAGWKDQRIADYLGMRLEEDVRPILDPSPPERKIGEFEEISRKPSQLSDKYLRVVGHSIHFQLEDLYTRAAFTAADEGFPELKEPLTERQHYHAGEAKALRASVGGDCEEEPQWKRILSADFCATLDARDALRIELVPERIEFIRRPLNAVFDDVIQLVERLPVVLKNMISRKAALHKRYFYHHD